MNPLARPFTLKEVRKSDKAESVHYEHTQRQYVGEPYARNSIVLGATPGFGKTGVTTTLADIDTARRAAVQTSSYAPAIDNEQVGTDVLEKLKRQLQVDAEEIAALKNANETLTQRLQEFEQETPEERQARKLKQKSAEIESLKASVAQATTQTEATKKQLAERQAYLRDLNTQLAKLRPAQQFVVKEKKQKAKGKMAQGVKEGNND